jgi:DNA polymerase elongation subunit (family B)
MVQYADYNELVDILDASNIDNAYQDVMKMEKDRLKTINAVVKDYKESVADARQFANLPLGYIIFRISEVWMEIFKAVVDDPKKGWRVAAEADRPLYIGLTLIALSLFFYLVDIVQRA